MAVLNSTSAGSTRAKMRGYVCGTDEFLYSEYTFPDNSVALNDVIEMFQSGTLDMLTVTGWEVFMDQVDTNGTPTVAFHIGCGDGSGISGTAGYRWATGTTMLGRSATMSMQRHDNGAHWGRNGGGQLVGLQVSALPATAAWAGKRVIMVLRVMHTGKM